MTMSVEAAAQALREATRETVRRDSTWYLMQGVLMVLAGIVALVYPFVSTVALVVVLGWLLILSGIVQGISLIGAQNVPNFWLQLVSAVLSIIVGVLFLRRPGEAVVTLALLLIVFFMVEGFAKLEPISKSFEEDDEASELHEAKEVLRIKLPADKDAALPLNPGEEPFDQPAPGISPKSASILRRALAAIGAVRRDHLDAVFA